MGHRRIDRSRCLVDLAPDRAQLLRRRIEHLAAVVDQLFEFVDEVFELGHSGRLRGQRCRLARQPAPAALGGAQQAFEVGEIPGLHDVFAGEEARQPRPHLDRARERQTLVVGETPGQRRHCRQPPLEGGRIAERRQCLYRRTPERRRQPLDQHRAHDMKLERIEIERSPRVVSHDCSACCLQPSACKLLAA